MNVRRPAEADLAAVVEVLRAVEEHDTGEAEWDERQLREHWDRIDLAGDAWLVEVDGRLAAYADLEGRAGDRLVADGYVHPELRGRGAGSAILELTEEEAAARGGTVIQNATTSPADDFYRARGYESVRRFRRMATELDGEPRPEVPPGLELRMLRPGEEREAHALVEEAFAEHWGHTARGFDEFARLTFAREGFDHGLCPVVEADGRAVGAAVNAWKENGDWGWIAWVSVRPGFRRRGIGELLMRASFAAFHRRGERRVALGVDAQNETGAARLYERLGMHTLWEAPVWEKRLRAD